MTAGCKKKYMGFRSQWPEGIPGGHQGRFCPYFLITYMYVLKYALVCFKVSNLKRGKLSETQLPRSWDSHTSCPCLLVPLLSQHKPA